MSASLPSDICFAMSMTDDQHKSANKHFNKWKKINEHPRCTEPLVPHIESDKTRRLYHTEPLVPHIEIYTKNGVRSDHVITELKSREEFTNRDRIHLHVTKCKWPWSHGGRHHPDREPPGDRSCDHRWIKIGCGLFRPLFNQSETGI